MIYQKRREISIHKKEKNYSFSIASILCSDFSFEICVKVRKYELGDFWGSSTDLNAMILTALWNLLWTCIKIWFLWIFNWTRAGVKPSFSSDVFNPFGSSFLIDFQFSNGFRPLRILYICPWTRFDMSYQIWTESHQTSTSLAFLHQMAYIYTHVLNTHATYYLQKYPKTHNSPIKTNFTTLTWWMFLSNYIIIKCQAIMMNNHRQYNTSCLFHMIFFSSSKTLGKRIKKPTNFLPKKELDCRIWKKNPHCERRTQKTSIKYIHDMFPFSQVIIYGNNDIVHRFFYIFLSMYSLFNRCCRWDSCRMKLSKYECEFESVKMMWELFGGINWV